MTARRIVVQDALCPHGFKEGHWEPYPDWCDGPDRRVLEPGRYVLIERDENGEWPGFTDEAELIAYDATCMADILDYLADALAQEPT